MSELDFLEQEFSLYFRSWLSHTSTNWKLQIWNTLKNVGLGLLCNY